MTRRLIVLLLLLGAAPALAEGLAAIEDGNAAYRAGQLEEAARAFTRAVEAPELSPAQLAVAYNNRGVVHDELGDHDRAIADYGRALELRPDHPMTTRNLALAHGNRGFVRAMRGEHRAAIADYDRALELRPEEALVHARRGRALAELGELERALEDFEAALALEAGLAEAEAGRDQVLERLAAREAAAEPEPAAPADTRVYVATTAVNMRAGPSNQHRVLEVLQANQRVRRIGEEAGWYQVETEAGARGFVYGTFLRPAD